VGVGEGDGVEMTDAARPENFRDDLFADVEILRGLVRPAAEATAVDEKRFAIGGDEEDGVALAYVNGFDEEGVAGVVDGAGEDYGYSGEDECGPGELAGVEDSSDSGDEEGYCFPPILKTARNGWSALRVFLGESLVSEDDGCCQQEDEGGGLDEKGGGDAGITPCE
jgi:hypothetical protein